MGAVATVRTLLDTTQVPRAHVLLVWLGQSGFAFKFHGGEVVFVDPYLSDAVEAQLGWKRLVRAPMATRDIPPALLLFTHEHLDHFDVDAVADLLGADQPPPWTFAGPRPCLELMERRGLPTHRFTVLKPGDALVFGGVRVEALHAEHTPGAVGYVLHCGLGRVYHTGDCARCGPCGEAAVADGSVGPVRPDVLLVAINGKFGNMGPEQAADFAAASEARVVVPMHYGMFAENTVAPAAFVRACCGRGIADRVRLLDVGAATLVPMPGRGPLA